MRRSVPGETTIPHRSSPGRARRRGALARLAGTLALALACSPLAAAEAPVDPWQTLAQLRASLDGAGALAASFRQSYLPAGFTTGDEERGRVALDLPDCLRWDYTEPYPKSYLLCGKQLHTWIAGEPQGERVRVAADDQAGLDLLLLPVASLRSRYRASAQRSAEGRLVLALVPTDGASKIAEATLELDPAGARPTALAYRDREGNQQRFTFESFAAIDDPRLFVPPTDLVWQER